MLFLRRSSSVTPNKCTLFCRSQSGGRLTLPSLSSSCVLSSIVSQRRRRFSDLEPTPNSAYHCRPMAKHSSQILEMARKGAEHRYEELKAEISSLVKNFPHLAGTASKKISRGRAVVEAEAPKVRRRARKMSAAARKAVSDRMKKYWAARNAVKVSTVPTRPTRHAGAQR